MENQKDLKRPGYESLGKQFLAVCPKRGWRDFAVYCLQVHPTAEFVSETPDIGNVDRMIFHLSGPVQWEHKYDGQTRQGQANPGNFTIVSGEASSSWRWDSPAKILYIYFFPSLLHQIANELDTPPTYREFGYLFNHYDNLIHQIGLFLYAELQTGKMFNQSYAESLVHILALHLLRNYFTPASEPRSSPRGLTSRQLSQVKEYIHAQMGTNISLTDLAATAGLSPFHFSRQFKQSIGLSPHQYLIQCRVNRAKSLLKKGQMTIAEVANEVGFADQSHLTRHFQRMFGFSPGYVLYNSKIGQKESKNFQES